MEYSYKTHGFLGAGNMAKAIAKGLIDKNVVESKNMKASAPSERNVADFKKWGANITHTNGDLSCCDVVWLCVKPHLMSTALSTLSASPNTLFISVAAGLTTQALHTMLAHDGCSSPRLIRTTPNTPIGVGHGATIYCAGEHAVASDLAYLNTALTPLSFMQELPESLMNAGNAVAGSGTGFVLSFIEALADGGVKAGLPRIIANKLAAQTAMGTAALVASTEQHPAVLRDGVCSPGGTTIHGVHELERGGLKSCVMDAAMAAKKRGDELGKM